jgi:hypothetical protein
MIYNRLFIPSTVYNEPARFETDLANSGSSFSSKYFTIFLSIDVVAYASSEVITYFVFTLTDPPPLSLESYLSVASSVASSIASSSSSSVASSIASSPSWSVASSIASSPSSSVASSIASSPASSVPSSAPVPAVSV